MQELRTCETCGEKYHGEWLRYSLYCSNACKQKAYRARKKQEKLARENTVSMEIYLHVDRIMDRIHDDSKDHFSTQLWDLLDTLRGAGGVESDVLFAIECAMLSVKESV